MDDWNPLQEDYDDPHFNSYEKGPGKYLPSRGQGFTREGMKQVQLFLFGIPKEIKEDGLEGLFSRAGHVKRVKIMPSKKENAGDTFGFVTMENVIAAERAIALFDGFRIGNFVLRVSVSKTKEELENIKKQREMNASMMAAQSGYGDFSDSDNDVDYKAQYNGPVQMNGVKDQNMNTGALGKGRGQKLQEITGVTPRGDADTTLTGRPKLNSISVDVGTYTGSVFKSTVGHGNLNDHSQLLTPVGRGMEQNKLRQPGSYVRRDRPQDQQYNYGQGQGDFHNGGGQGAINYGRGRGQADFNYGRGRGQMDFNYGRGRGDFNYGGGQAQFNYGRGRGQGEFNYGRGRGYGRGYYQNQRGRGGYQNYYSNYGGFQPVMPMPVIMQPYSMPPMYVQEQNNVASPPIRQECSVCGTLGVQRCSRCKVPYCSSKCQKDDWPKHKHTCNKSSEENEITKTFEGFDVGIDDDLIPKVKELMEKTTGDKFDITRKSASLVSSHNSQSSFTSDDDRPSKKKDNKRQVKRDKKGSDDSSRDRNTDKNRNVISRGQDRGTKGRRTDGKDQKRGNDGNKARTGMPDDRDPRCFSCQQVGHISRECPKKKGNSPSPGSQSSQGTGNINKNNENRDKGPATSSSSKPVASSTPKEAKKSAPRKNLPCLCMPLNEEMRVILSDVTDPGHFYLQIAQLEYCEPFKDLMEEIHQKYTKSAPDVQSVMVGEIYCARFSLDQAWYRAQVLKVSGEQVMVHFLDFGNVEVTSLENVRHLADNLAELPSQAVLCTLDGILPKTGDSWKIPATELVKYLPTDQPMNAICQSITDTADGKQHSVILKNMNGENVAKKLLSADLVRSVLEEENASLPESNPKLLEQHTVKVEDRPVLMFCDMKKSQEDLAVGQEFPLAISNVISPIVFSVQIIESSQVEKFVAFNAKFNEECSACAESEYRPKLIGELVASLFSQDKGWYRARVLELVQTGAVVEYIDYLNSETVTFDMMRKPTAMFMQYPAQGIMCTYHGLVEPTCGTWPEDLIALYLKMSQFPLTGIVKAVVKETVSIEIMISGEVVTEAIHEIMAHHEAASSGKASTDEIEKKSIESQDMQDQTKTDNSNKETSTGTTIDKKGQIAAGDLPMDGSRLRAMVSCVSAVDGVYVQDLDPGVDEQLRGMMLDLHNSVIPEESIKPSEGDCVAVRITINGTPLWHRACVKTKVSEDSFMVTLVDYGNTVCVKLEDIAHLSSKFLTTPAFAVQCQLAGTEKSESSDLLMKLQALTDHEVFVQAVNYNKGIFSIVVTLTDGKNVNEAFECYTSAISQNSLEAECAATRPSLTTKVTTATTSDRQLSLSFTELPVGQKEIKLKIVYIVNLAKFYMHLCDPDQDVKLLECLKEMQVEYANDETLYSAVIGEYVAVYYDDGSGAVWYRGKVLDTKDDVDTVKVAIIDYGNEGVVAKQHIRRLDDKFTALPVVACECRLVGSTGEEPKEMIDQFRCLETDVDDLDVGVVSKIGNLYLVDVIMRDALKTKVSEFLELDTSVTQPLISGKSDEVPDTTNTGYPVSKSAGTVSPAPNMTFENGCDHDFPGNKLDMSPPAIKTLDSGVEDSELPLNTDVSAVTFVIESIKSFFVQMADEETQQTLASLMVQLAEYCTGTDEAYTPASGEIVAALFVDGTDANWYRGQVIEVVDSKCAKVFFLDYGNTETVLFKDIRILESRFLTVPKIAIHCRLSGSGVETEEMLQKFQTISNVPMTVSARSYYNGLYEVDVTTPDGRNLSSDLGLIPDFASGQNNSPSTAIVDNLPKQVSPRSDALPKKVSSPPRGEKKAVFTQTLKKSRPDGDAFKAVITSIVNPNDFHCQIYPEGEHTSLQQELKFLSDTMKLECDDDIDDACELTFEVGELCCAKFPVDNCWYRASVLEIFSDKTVKVEYVDFGNCSDVPVSSLRPVTMDYTRLPLLAFRCSLHGISPAGSSWTDQSLIELAKFQDVKLDAKVIDVNNDVYTIELADEAKNIVINEHMVSTGLAKSNDATEDISEMEKLRRENEVMRRQMEALQAKLAGAR